MSRNGTDLLDQLVRRLEEEEDLELEFKTATWSVPSSMWPTVSAFANTVGGWIILGVDGRTKPATITGVQDAAKVAQEIQDLMRNPQKIKQSPCGENDVKTYKLGDRELIVMRVRAAARSDRPIYMAGCRIKDSPDPHLARLERDCAVGHERKHQARQGEVHREDRRHRPPRERARPLRSCPSRSGSARYCSDSATTRGLTRDLARTRL